ncbi:MAG: hypothetical protein LBH25_05940 [Fibromonadaceae bacterium]|nr:hypothetical protein [Fibromonadaceae bacterium]
MPRWSELCQSLPKFVTHGRVSLPTTLTAALVLAIVFSLPATAFAVTAADFYGVWTRDITSMKDVSDIGMMLDKSSLDEGYWRFANGRITFPNTNKWCQLVSAKVMDCHYSNGKKYTYKKEYESVAQYEKSEQNKDKARAKQDSIRQQAELMSERPLYIGMEQAKASLQQIYSEHKNITKGEFESTADFNKRKAEIDKNLKDSTELYFNDALYFIVADIEDNNEFIFDFVKYDADKQISEIEFRKYKISISGKVKMPPEIAKNLRDDKSQFSIKYENTDLRSVDYALVPIKISIYDASGSEYKVPLDIPKNAKEIVFKGSELWKDNPYAKNISISLAKAIERYAPVKEAARIAAAEAEEAERKAAEEAERIKLKKQQEEEVFIKKGLTDSRDGNKYRIVKIGTQIWMAENLNYKTEGSKCYGEGETETKYIPAQGKYKNIPGYGTYEDNVAKYSGEEIQSYCKKYGRLYDWNEAKKSCPGGWHLPNNGEWETLIDFAGGEVFSKKFRAKSWNSGTNDFGFSALPGGQYVNEKRRSFSDEIGGSGYWWSSSDNTIQFTDAATISEENLLGIVEICIVFVA